MEYCMGYWVAPLRFSFYFLGDSLPAGLTGDPSATLNMSCEDFSAD
jgi:hypothetical protein